MRFDGGRDPVAAGLGDMPVAEFREEGKRVVEWAARYFETIGELPVLAQVKPGDVEATLPLEPPEEGEPMAEIVADLDRLIVPGMTHWGHPRFFAYFAASGSAPGVLADLASSAFNVNGMLWRTGPAASELERVVLGWLRRMVGLPDSFWGMITEGASLSTLQALAAARECVPGLEARERGLSGRPDAPRLRVYASEHAHSSVDRAAAVLGIGLEGVRRIPADSEFRMQPAALEAAIGEDLDWGWTPMAAVATAGTTSTASIDPVRDVAAVCRRHGLWLHVDAAYGGSAAVAPSLRWVMDGVQEADSVVINPHKWLYVPIDLSVLYTRRPEDLKRAFTLVPDYLQSPEVEVDNYVDSGITMGRRFRALKLWFVIRYFGWKGLAERLENQVRLARVFADLVEHDPRFELAAPVSLGTVCFRLVAGRAGVSPEDLDRRNHELLESVNRDGRIYLSHTRLGGRYVLRFSVGGIRTAQADVRLAWDVLCGAAGEVREAV